MFNITVMVQVRGIVKPRQLGQSDVVVTPTFLETSEKRVCADNFVRVRQTILAVMIFTFSIQQTHACFVMLRRQFSN